MSNSSSTFDDLELSSDFMFKHVMRRADICKYFLELLLHIKIADIAYIETEQTIDPYYDSRGIRLDIKVVDEHNTHYNLEMQVNNPVNKLTNESLLPKRTRYYQAMLDVDMLQKGQDFDELPPSFIIFVCPFDCFNEGQRIYTFKKRCLETPALELPDEATVIFLNTTGTKGTIPKELQSLYDYINTKMANSDFTQNIADTIVKIKNDKKVRQDFMTYEMRMKDVHNAAFAEGESIGEARGKSNTTFSDLKNIMQNFNITIDKAMDVLKTPQEERQFYKDLLAKGM